MEVPAPGGRLWYYSHDVISSIQTLFSADCCCEAVDQPLIGCWSLIDRDLVVVSSGSRQLFSLLSVTSYSALDLHKLTLLVYNSNYHLHLVTTDQ